MRWKITIEYDGTPFVGWQRQKDCLGVQQVIEEALFKITRETVIIYGSGRTDAGVHAKGQVAHFDLHYLLSAHRLREALNYHLNPHPIAIIEALEVTDEFHARFQAFMRSYTYRIINRYPRLTLEQNRAWHVREPLEAPLMHGAAQLLVGKHDFSTFRASGCQALSPIKTLSSIAVERQGEEIFIHIKAPSFIYHQVRNIAGTLNFVGRGKWTIDDFRVAFLAKTRTAGGPTAPAHGLYFRSVSYPPKPVQ